MMREWQRRNPDIRSPTPALERIIGGMFGGEARASVVSDPPFLEGKFLLLANGRSAIRVVTDAFLGGKVWLPGYLCAAVLLGIADHSRVRFYPIDRQLQASDLGWLREIQPGDIVLVIEFFGFPCDPHLCQQVSARRAWLLKDASHALLSKNIEAGTNFIVYSPRKTVAVPDGGVLVIRDCDEWPAVRLFAPPPSWTRTSQEAFLARAEFDLHGGERRFFPLFQQAEREAPAGPVTMSGTTEAILRESFDYAAIARQRRENYQALATRLGHLAIFPVLPEGVVPLGFPIRLRDRERVRQEFFREDIFPPMHWPVPPSVPREFSDSYQLSGESLTLVCDQRYDLEDMERTCDVLLRSLS
jgi:hypothetical protein